MYGLQELIESTAFAVFNTWLLGALSLGLALIYVHKFFNGASMVPRGASGYLIKSFNWLVFGIAFLVFPSLPLATGRALLRTAVAFLLLSELIYFWYDLKIITSQAAIWTRRKLRPF